MTKKPHILTLPGHFDYVMYMFSQRLKAAYSTLILAFFISGCNPIKPQSNEPATAQPVVPAAPDLLLDKVVTTHYDQLPAQPPVSDLWQRVRDSYSLDLSVENKRIDSQIRWFSKHQSYLDRVSDRALRYMYFIMEQVEVRGVPGELALLPIVESAFDPFAYSHGRASGVWQFIPSTGRLYGMKQDWWYDGRRDIRLSTIGALRYLEALAREFKGDWMLALAAYNSGAGTVRKAIRKNKRKGKPTDFWSLSLPRETRAYVPKLYALAKMLDDPKKYGVSFKPLPNRPYFAVVKTGSQMDLSQAAEMAEVEIEEIYRLNPQYNQWATSPNGPHELLVPFEKRHVFARKLANLPEIQRIKWQRYKVKSGDSLISIAKHFHTTPEALTQVNPIRGNLIRVGDTLLIPTAFNSLKSYSHSAGNRLKRKQRLTRAPKGSSRIDHVVQSGDSFWELSKQHNVSVRSLAKWNGMAPTDPLKPGQKLVIWSKAPWAKNNREVIRKIRYRVRNGDSLYRIADKFRVSVKDIKRWNQISKAKKYLQPGDELVLYVDVTSAG